MERAKPASSHKRKATNTAVPEINGERLGNLRKILSWKMVIPTLNRFNVMCFVVLASALPFSPSGCADRGWLHQLNDFLDSWLKLSEVRLEIGTLAQLLPLELHTTVLWLLKDDALCARHGIILHGRKRGVRTRVELRRDIMSPFEVWEVQHLFQSSSSQDIKRMRKDATRVAKSIDTKIMVLRLKNARLARTIKRLRLKTLFRLRPFPAKGRSDSRWSKSRLLKRLSSMIQGACASTAMIR